MMVTAFMAVTFFNQRFCYGIQQTILYKNKTAGVEIIKTAAHILIIFLTIIIMKSASTTTT